MEATQQATEESKRTVAVLTEVEKLKQTEFLKDNELLYNKRLMDYEDPNKRGLFGLNFVLRKHGEGCL